MSGWQRIWVVVSIIAMIIVSLFTWDAMPNEDKDVITDINNKNCSYLVNMPEGYKLDSYPSYNSACYDLAYVKYRTTMKVSSVEDYRSYLNKERNRIIFVAVKIWLGFIASLYCFGWAIGWIIRGFRGQ